jgi:Restriction endonuclease
MAIPSAWSDGMISALLAVVMFIVLAALAAAIGAEFLGWLPVFVRFLVGVAVKQLPAEQRERYREEFLSDIASKAAERNVTALIWALGTCISARGLARTLGEQRADWQNARHATLDAVSRSAHEDVLEVFTETLARLHPREFEELIAELFTKEGYDVFLTPASHDNGVDLYVTKRTQLGSLLYVVACKRYRPERPVGLDLVRQLRGTVEREGATAGILVTTSSFSAGARKEQTAVPFKLSLCDNRDLQRWLRDYDTR